MKDREKEIKYEMYLCNEKIKQEKKKLKELKKELERLRGNSRKRIKK